MAFAPRCVDAAPKALRRERGLPPCPGLQGQNGDLDTIKDLQRDGAPDLPILLGLTLSKPPARGGEGQEGHGVVLCPLHPTQCSDTGCKAISSLEMQVYSHAPTCLMTKALFSEPSDGL